MSATPAVQWQKGLHDDVCEGSFWFGYQMEPCACSARHADRIRFQAENWDRVRVATEGEKDEVLRWLNDNEPDMLRLAMDEAGQS